jgi:uncharacterized protein (DUF39 family)
MKTQAEINAKIRNGTALVMTATEFKQHVRNGDTITCDEVDVVTTGTFGVMSGTYAVLSIPIAEKKAFKTADRVWLNGVPAVPGPCPNENLGLVDLMVYGTAHANASYGGGHLFRDLVQGNPVDVVVQNGKHLPAPSLSEILDLHALQPPGAHSKIIPRWSTPGPDR